MVGNGWKWLEMVTTYITLKKSKAYILPTYYLELDIVVPQVQYLALKLDFTVENLEVGMERKDSNDSVGKQNLS